MNQRLAAVLLRADGEGQVIRDNCLASCVHTTFQPAVDIHAQCRAIESGGNVHPRPIHGIFGCRVDTIGLKARDLVDAEEYFA